MKRYRVKMVAELQAESEDEAIEFLEASFGDISPETVDEAADQRILTLEVGSGEVIDTPEWVVKAAKDPDRR